jgi:hypothetical protein
LPGSAIAAAPANDDFQNAEVITAAETEPGLLTASVPGTTVEATAQTGEPHSTDSLDRDRPTVWYSWTAPYGGEDARINLGLCVQYPVAFALYTKAADPVPPFSNLTDLGAILGTPPPGFTCGPLFIGLLVDAGQTYYFQVAGQNGGTPGDAGPFTLLLEQYVPHPPFPTAAPPLALASTGLRAKALKRCKKKFPKGPRRTKCIKKAKRLPL